MKRLQGIQPVILAGGKSRRMGSNKALLSVGEKRLIEVIAGRLSQVFSSCPLLITNTPEEYEFLNLPMTGDVFPDAGPLGGIHSALKHVRLPYIFVYACDMPFVEAALIAHMAAFAKEFDIVVPYRGFSPEPLHAIYSRSCLPFVEASLGRGERRIIEFFPSVRVCHIKEQEISKYAPRGLSFININTPDDLAEVRKFMHI